MTAKQGGPSRAEIGRRAEGRAVAFLKAHGYRVVAERVRRGPVEIDVLAYDGDVLCFVEVRARKSARYGTAARTVTRTKQQRLIRCASQIVAEMQPPPRCRFDVVGIDGDQAPALIKNAFSAWVR